MYYTINKCQQGCSKGVDEGDILDFQLCGELAKNKLV